ncbi:hypothetical protein C7S18_09230 [Ahniella affigens]|uniref:Nucleotidyltransferase family protein n=1 Tax=Ahniella affigens TaxID=2021234 RepID=A0A2P1PRA6_9GAMM|nr:nucleotidyltransferase family protein [Ahniella affigens]AVP97364.1 hypothetical protein C7S18_09230 [Ahniella affigens]
MTDFNDRFVRLLRATAAKETQTWTLDQTALAVLDGEGMLALALNAGASVAPEARPWVQNRMAALRLRDQLHGRVLGRLADINRQLPEPMLLFKGEALARNLYSDSASRQRNDLDLLVPEPALTATLNALQSAGFRLQQALTSRYARFEVVLDAGLPTPVGLDVHIRPFFRPWRLQHRPYDRLIKDASPLPGWPDIPAPSAGDAILLAALHLAKNPHQRAIWWFDLHLLRHVPGAEATALATHLTPDDRAIVELTLARARLLFESEAEAVSWPAPERLSRLSAWWRDTSALPTASAQIRFCAELLGFGVRRSNR